ncbi:terminase gpA endonuclease subunit, partial [Escherichia coli]
KGDTGKRKTFVNTTLGETWEAKIGERPDAEVMAERKEHYSAPVPDRVAYLTAGIDSQLDRYEMRVWGWGPGEESWLIDRQIIMGRHDDEQTLLRVDEAINKTYNPSVFKDTYQYGYTSSGQNTWGVQGSVGMSTGWLANTSTDGNHSHSLSGTAASAGAHAHTVGIGAHTHSVAIGSHGHTITVNAAGNAENTVKNIAFNYIVRLA